MPDSTSHNYVSVVGLHGCSSFAIAPLFIDGTMFLPPPERHDQCTLRDSVPITILELGGPHQKRFVMTEQRRPWVTYGMISGGALFLL